MKLRRALRSSPQITRATLRTQPRYRNRFANESKQIIWDNHTMTRVMSRATDMTPTGMFVCKNPL